MSMLRKIGTIWAQYRAFQATLAELERCSDRDLADIGIPRAEIVRIAYEAAESSVGAAGRLPPSQPQELLRSAARRLSHQGAA
jgi:uncharacterized protein YjiS (DUF1127 family)